MTQEHIHADKTAIELIGSLAQAASAAQTNDGVTHLVLPPNYSHHDITGLIEKVKPNPNRKHGTVVLNAIESFIAYTKDQGKEGITRIYADPDARTLTAVFNDHAATELAGWRDQRATFKAELSREFETWMKHNGVQMSQEDFAIFLEDNIADVVEPGGDTLLKVALTLQAKTEASFSSSKRLDNGQVQFTYTENIDARASSDSIEVPREFFIGCRLFKNGDGYRIKARLKYRLHGGQLKFWYELDRPQNAIEHEFTEYVKKANETNFPILIGKP